MMNRLLKPLTGLDPLVALSLASVLLFFAVSGTIAYIDLQTLRKDNQEIVLSGDVIVALDELLSKAQDAETGQRGFLLTQNEKYLAPFDTALDSIPLYLKELARLTRENPTQQAQIPLLTLHLNAKLAELKRTLDLNQTKGHEAALSLVNTDRGKAEMDALRAQLTAMKHTEEGLRVKRLGEATDAFRSAVASGIFSGVLGAVLTLIVGYLIARASRSRQRETWLQSGRAGLSMAMQGDLQPEQLGDKILEFLTRYVGAIVGAVFIQDGEHYRRAATYGVPGGANIPESFSGKEGLLGQATTEARPILLTDVPEGYLCFGSALGQDKPKHLVIAPAANEGHVNAVVELGFLQPIEADVSVLLDQAAASIAVAVRSAKYRADLRRLLDETQRKSEELQVQGEELRVSNEELEEQCRALRESQSRLENQQAELEQTNAQLEEQAQQLETQRDDLERANAAVQLKASEVERASQFKSEFLANMSHELRTPLNSSLILAKLLADNPEDNLTPEQVNYARTIQSSGNDLLILINDILDLSKIEAGHVEIRPETISLAQLMDSLKRTFQPIAQEKNLTFSTEIEPACPDLIVSDLQRLEQVLKNLLSNAFKFTETGSVSLAIRREAEDQIAISVTDTGIGISEDQQRSVFEAFRQADGTISRRYGGTGLGLSISRELMRLLGGTIRLQSRPGHGSTFSVVFPQNYNPVEVASREPPPPAIVHAISPADIPVRASSPITYRKIEDDRNSLIAAKRVLLVIEDDDAFAGVLRDLSHEMGFQALVAGTAEEALSLARQYLPSAVILDIGLPDQSGLSVLDQLKRDVQTRHIPIHVVSASDHTQTALSLGAIGYMIKPVSHEELADVLKKFEERLSQRMHRVLIVEDDLVQREAVSKLLSSEDVETVAAGTAAECLQLLKEQTFDCMVLDLSLPDASGYSLLETLSREDAYSFPPVIVYTGRDLSANDEQRLRRYSKSIIIKGAKSPERLLDEVTLFLHQIVATLPAEQQKMIRKAQSRDALLEGRRILIVEDDIRNIYALTNVLEPRGARIEIARNGREALDMLAKCTRDPALAIDLVLMDIMMPTMDGLTATREIRKNPEWKKLPVIALTAKAMPDDQQRCIEAGANDYMAKPVDVDKLLSLVRVWMPR